LGLKLKKSLSTDTFRSISDYGRCDGILPQFNCLILSGGLLGTNKVLTFTPQSVSVGVSSKNVLLRCHFDKLTKSQIINLQLQNQYLMGQEAVFFWHFALFG